MTKEALGLVHVYTGDGKGKTTAALGLALRAAGHGLRTYFGQFMKGQEYGELEAAPRLGRDEHGRLLVTLEQFGRTAFLRAGQATDEDVRLAHAGLARVEEALHSEQYDIVVLDEINVALHFQLLTIDDVLGLLDRRPAGVELVLTGRRVPDAIVARADYVTEMREIRHPYQRGIQAREGVEF